MQEAVTRGLLCCTDALNLAKMKIGQMKQDELVEILEKEGIEAYRKELESLAEKKLKKRSAKMKMLDPRSNLRQDVSARRGTLRGNNPTAETKKMKLDEYCKWVLTEYVRNQEHISEQEPKK